MRVKGKNGKFLGIDGCRGGWVGVICDENLLFQQPVLLLKTTTEMIRIAREFRLALIDIPIGLSEGPENVRLCDLEARKRLGPRRASIFAPPIRQVLKAKSYAEGCKINFQICSKEISKQSWNLLPRIRVIDQIFSSQPDFQKKIRESHPEICFWALNGYQPILMSKKTPGGLQARLTLLQKRSENAHDFFRLENQKYPGKMITKDDLIDAMVLALHAAKIIKNDLISLPSVSQLDARGLRMEIVYADLR